MYNIKKHAYKTVISSMLDSRYTVCGTFRSAMGFGVTSCTSVRTTHFKTGNS